MFVAVLEAGAGEAGGEPVVFLAFPEQKHCVPGGGFPIAIHANSATVVVTFGIPQSPSECVAISPLFTKICIFLIAVVFSCSVRLLQKI